MTEETRKILESFPLGIGQHVAWCNVDKQIGQVEVSFGRVRDVVAYSHKHLQPPADPEVGVKIETAGRESRERILENLIYDEETLETHFKAFDLPVAPYYIVETELGKRTRAVAAILKKDTRSLREGRVRQFANCKAGGLGAYLITGDAPLEEDLVYEDIQQAWDSLATEIMEWLEDCES